MFYSIQFLRAIAAIVVVLFHTNGALEAYFNSSSVLASLYRHGDYGVDIFFVISGFIISYMVCERKQKRDDFVINRIARIVPPYWLLTFITFALACAMPQLFRSLNVGGQQLFWSLTFLSWTQGDFPIINVGWTLSYEILFYIAIVAFYKRVMSLGWREIVLPVLLISLSPFLFRGLENNQGINVFFFLEFLAGMVAFLAFRNRLSIAVSVSLIALMALCSMVWAEPRVTNGLFLGLISLGVVLGIEKIKPNFFNKRLILDLGNGSYAIYLLQTLTVPASAKLLSRSGVAYADVIFMFFAPVMTCALGILFYRFVETKLIFHSRSLLQRWHRRSGS